MNIHSLLALSNLSMIWTWTVRGASSKIYISWWSVITPSPGQCEERCRQLLARPPPPHRPPEHDQDEEESMLMKLLRITTFTLTNWVKTIANWNDNEGVEKAADKVKILHRTFVFVFVFVFVWRWWGLKMAPFTEVKYYQASNYIAKPCMGWASIIKLD